MLLVFAVAVALAVPGTKRLAPYADPKGAAHGWAAFSDRARMASRKIPAHAKPRAVDVSGRRFSLVPFLLGSTKRNELGRASGQKRLMLLRPALDRFAVKSEHQNPTLPLASRRAGSFLLLAPRTQCERRRRPRRCESKKRNQRKGPAPTERTRPVVRSGIFRLAILARSENGGHPCPPPAGCAMCSAASRRSKAGRVPRQTDAENRYPDPRTVCTIPSSALGSSVLRSRRMCTSTVRSST